MLVGRLNADDGNILPTMWPVPAGKPDVGARHSRGTRYDDVFVGTPADLVYTVVVVVPSLYDNSNKDRKKKKKKN